MLPQILKLLLIVIASFCACGLLGMYAVISLSFINSSDWYSIYTGLTRALSCVAMLLIYFVFIYETLL
jgi:heme A synthase